MITVTKAAPSLWLLNLPSHTYKNKTHRQVMCKEIEVRKIPKHSRGSKRDPTMLSCPVIFYGHYGRNWKEPEGSSSRIVTSFLAFYGTKQWHVLPWPTIETIFPPLVCGEQAHVPVTSSWPTVGFFTAERREGCSLPSPWHLYTWELFHPALSSTHPATLAALVLLGKGDMVQCMEGE